LAHNEFCLRPGEALTTDQWLRSKNGLFHGVIQKDGNFCIYRGDWKEAKVNTCLWDTVSHDCGGKSYTGGKLAQWCLYMQEDGNLIISEPGGGPVWALSTNHKNVMASGTWAVLYDDGNFAVASKGEWNHRKFATDVTDTVDESSYEWNELVYDLKNGAIVETSPPRFSHAITATNHTASQQSTSLSMQYLKSKTFSWKTTTTIKVGVKAFAKLELPGVGEAGLEVTGEVAQSAEFGETKTESETIVISMPVVVPVGKKIAGTCTWRESKIKVPFIGKGKATFRGLPDVKIPIHFDGVYEGVQSHSVNASWEEIDEGTSIDSILKS